MQWWMIALGIATGLRTMTPIAVLCWFAYFQLLPESGWAVWAGKLISAIVFTVLALGEYVGDTRPNTPNRTAAGPLTARLFFGALVGALAAKAMSEPLAGGLLFGVVGALIGTYAGFGMRAAAARRLGRDLPVAIGESLLALLIALTAAHGLHHEVVRDLGTPYATSAILFPRR